MAPMPTHKQPEMAATKINPREPTIYAQILESSIEKVPLVGLEPTRPFTGPWILNPMRLPFRHSGNFK